jgi:5-deoxy-D-glucuronate isomerase
LDREQAEWKWMSMAVRRLAPGDVVRASTQKEECAFVLLGGKCIADWGAGPRHIGKRANQSASSNCWCRRWSRESPSVPFNWKTLPPRVPTR